ncbi:MAG TPA: hypothetical protein VLB04_13660 [Methanotrichaceae archaeon]|nr:hypothetical protein [Methanotrichaceae archaeon]
MRDLEGHSCSFQSEKPKSASKVNEKRKAEALQRAFDRIPDPTKAQFYSW